MARPPVAIIAAAGIVALVIAGSSMPTKKKTPVPKEFERVKSLANKWAKKFSVPLPLVLMIAQIESSFRPGLYNLNARAIAIGGCWGVVAMSLLYGAEKVTQIRAKLPGDADIRATLVKWNPQATVPNIKTAVAAKDVARLTQLAQPLLDPDVCLLLGVYMLSGLWHKYKDFAKVAAAYHSGSVPVDAAIKANVPVTSKLGPAGREYVARAVALWPTYQAYT